MLDVHTLNYFVTLIREGNVSRAAKALHITQPTLSRQLARLEEQVGKPLYERKAGRAVPTAVGSVLYDYAVSIMELVDKAEEEILQPEQAIQGTVRIGAAETAAISYVARAAAALQAAHPQTALYLDSGATLDHMERVMNGSLDFLLEAETVSRPGFESLPFPVADRWVAIVRADDPLASRPTARPRDFEGKSVALSRQALKAGLMDSWFGDSLKRVNVLETHNLTTNATFFVREGLAYTFSFAGLHDMRGLAQVPLEPTLESSLALIWRKDRHLSKVAETFLLFLKSEFDKEPPAPYA